MKAMILTKTGPVENDLLQPSEIPAPKPRDDEILVKITLCGACHTDLDIVEGRLKPTINPVIPGHQIVGTVAENGKDAKKFKIGQRVGITWLYSSCGNCYYCNSNRENLCENARWTGKDAHGGYAEYISINEKFAHSIPNTFSDAHASPLLCAGVIGYRTFKLAQIQDKQTIGLFGFGGCAHIIIQVIKYKFPNSPVFVFTKTKHHAELAKKLGADWTGRSGDKPPQKLNKALDFTPVGECTRDALEVLAPGGRLVINAIRKETPVPALKYEKFLWHEKEIKSVANVSRKDAEDFLPLAAEIPIKPTVEQFPLEQANQVLEKMKNSLLKAAAALRIS